MRAKSFRGMVCNLAGAIEAIGDRWSLLILRDLAFRPSRYDDLQASTGIPTTTLAQRLKGLEASGIVARRPYQTRPLRYEYRLTEKGRDLVPALAALAEWGDRWDASGRGAPPIVRIDARTGRPVKTALVDAETGTPIPPNQMRAIAGPGADDALRTRLANPPAKSADNGGTDDAR